MKNFYECGNLDEKKNKLEDLAAPPVMKVSGAKQIFTADSNISTRSLCQQLDVSFKSAQRVLRRKLSMYPYKVQICQKLHDVEFDRRADFYSCSCRRMKKTILLLEG